MNILMKKQNKKTLFFKLYLYYYKDVYLLPRGSCTHLTSDWRETLITTMQSKYRKFKQKYNNRVTKNI